ncbi:MAG: ISAzo13 family transposase, partial [Planctomycetaceae bacterium]|nr:ISAzo13 family transposase [Planctomycetaceae bacterium]
TTTKNGLKIKCVIDEKKYKKGIIVNNIELEKLNITPHKFQSEWNYTIKKQKF